MLSFTKNNSPSNDVPYFNRKICQIYVSYKCYTGLQDIYGLDTMIDDPHD